MGVLGRDLELDRIGTWLQREQAGRVEPAAAQAVLVIEGEPGIGKTTLWAAAVGSARQAGWDVLSCRPAPSDVDLARRSAGPVRLTG
jgi:hypothetical protein